VLCREDRREKEGQGKEVDREKDDERQGGGQEKEEQRKKNDGR
jgi:hypothetical protein